MRVILVFLIAFLPFALSALDYGKIARELETTSKDSTVKKIAVLPFEDLDQKNSPMGRTVQEELTFALVRETRFTVVERSLVDRALNELQFQTTGAIDAASARQLGKGIGAEAVVTGTIQRDGSGYRVMARLIRTDTFTILAVSSGSAKEGVTAREEREKPTVVTSPTKFFFAFDIFGGMSTSDLSITYGKPAGDYPLVNSTHVGLPGVATQYRMIEFADMNVAEETPPMGVRLRMGDQSIPAFVFGFEFIYHSLSVPRQSATVILNDGDSSKVSLNDTYLKFRMYQLNMPILYSYNQHRFSLAGGVFWGFNFGVLSSSIIQYYDIVSEQFKPTSGEVGFGMHGGLLLMGLVHLSENFSLLVEGRFSGSYTEFNRDGDVAGGLLSEDTTITMSGFQFYAGLSARWE